uniref:Uncharacterized protein n=1 Tax=Cacopsylla melanoneura TaxID=428564 RepID=A0A8D9A0T7_9HEMI
MLVASLVASSSLYCSNASLLYDSDNSILGSVSLVSEFRSTFSNRLLILFFKSVNLGWDFIPRLELEQFCFFSFKLLSCDGPGSLILFRIVKLFDFVRLFRCLSSAWAAELVPLVAKSLILTCKLLDRRTLECSCVPKSKLLRFIFSKSFLVNVLDMFLSVASRLE